MDFDGYWQENKRFLIAVGGGVVLFLIGWMTIASFFGDELSAQRRRLKSLQSDLKEPMHTSADLAAARAENEALEAVFDELAGWVEFAPRPEFALREGDAASSRYFGVVSDVRDDLLVRCGRAGLAFPDDLGLPKLAPTREQEIARYLEALDVVEATLSMGIDTGCERVDRIRIDLDPRLLSNRPIEDLEKTLIECRLTGPAQPMVALLGLLQQERDGRVILVERVDLQSARSARDDVRMDLVLSVAHLHGMGPDEDGRGRLMALDLRKEHVVLGGTVAVLGLLLWQGSSTQAGDGLRKSRASRAQSGLEFASHPAPDTALARPAARTLAGAGDRDLFAPPRDTRPLAPLDVVPPPLPVLSALRPPPVPSVAPAHFGSFLRADPTPNPVSGLFVIQDERDENADSPQDPLMSEELEALRELGYMDGVSDEALSPEQRAARVESWKALYDWIRITEGDPIFGRIQNSERYGLPDRPGDAILFVEVLPKSGAERFPGLEPVPFARERVLDFGFANTASNRIQLRRAELAGELSASLYADLLAFADECVALRNEAREALRFAEEGYTRAAAFDPEDPAPILGLAHCYEAGFRLEEAYGTYLDVIERFGHRPEGHVGLGQLEARLRLFESAEERLRHAETLERASYGVQWALGRFLLDRGRSAEALAHLRDAYRFEPSEPAAVRVRAEIRADLGAALLAEGDVEEALSSFDRALSASATHQRALAGRLAAISLGAGGDPPAGTAAGAADGDSAHFELVLVRALIQLERGELAPARDELELAAETDPLRAHAAWRALSWLAETGGFPEEAWRWIEAAHLADPTDAWTLYQRGRLQAASGDMEGARASFMGALDRELDFADALVALGELAYRTEQPADAELFFERALGIDAARPEVHALRGLNLLELGELGAAGEAFDAAIALDPGQALAHAGQAWISYLGGDAERSVTLFAELDDRRRALPEDDVYRVYAKEQLARIVDHEEKEAWSERFERRQLKNGWNTEESSGPEVRLADGQLVIEGVFKQNGEARVFRLLPAPDFVSIEMDVTVMPANNTRVGVFLSKERRRGAGVVEVQGMISAAREKDGGLALLAMDVAQADPEWTDIPELEGEAGWWPAGRAVRVRLEKVGAGSEASARVFVDGVPVREDIPMRRLSSSSSELKLGVFVEGQTGLPAHVVVDDVEMIYRIGKR